FGVGAGDVGGGGFEFAQVFIDEVRVRRGDLFEHCRGAFEFTGGGGHRVVGGQGVPYVAGVRQFVGVAGGDREPDLGCQFEAIVDETAAGSARRRRNEQ